MVGFRAGDVPPTATVKFIGAGTAACIADLFTFPLDTAKVRLQVSFRCEIGLLVYVFTCTEQQLSWQLRLKMTNIRVTHWVDCQKPKQTIFSL